MKVAHSRLLQCLSISQDLGSLIGLLHRLSLGCRGTFKVVAAECSWIRGDNTNLGMQIVHGCLLECKSISQDISTLISKLIILGFRSRRAVKVVTPEASSIHRTDSNLRMHKVHSRLLQCLSIGKNTCPLIRDFDIFHLGCRGTFKVVTTKCRGILSLDGILRMEISPRGLLKLHCILQNLGDLIGILVLETFGSGRTVKVVAPKASSVSGHDRLLGVEKGSGEILKSTSVS